MKVVKKIADVRQLRWQQAGTWGLIPTMGFLHKGHLSLVEAAREANDFVGVSIFVNPIQFDQAVDLEKYPRDLDRDLKLLETAGADLVWVPAAAEVYPANFQTYVAVEKLSQPLEGAAREGHFRGVATVVALIFNVFQPTRAYFGEKDAQQLRVIRRMVSDLAFNMEVIGCATVREEDGLAMSSRNARLSAEARQQAISLHQALQTACKAFENGEQDAQKLKTMMRKVIDEHTLTKVDYVSVADTETLQELDKIGNQALLSLAVFVDDVRLIDNIIVSH